VVDFFAQRQVFTSDLLFSLLSIFDVGAGRIPANDLPLFKLDMRETPCTHNPLGVKGCGEAGAIGAPAAVMNAITHALGVKDIAMPATAQTVWRSIRV